MTLVEVLLAISILGAGLVVMLTAGSRCLAVMRIARNYQSAQWTLGMGEIDYPLEIEEDIEELVVDPEEYPNGFTFSREVDEDEDEDGLYVVRTRVTWSDRGRHGVEEVVRYVLFEAEDDGTGTGPGAGSETPASGGGTPSSGGAPAPLRQRIGPSGPSAGRLPL
jgi:hypothetical protein